MVIPMEGGRKLSPYSVILKIYQILVVNKSTGVQAQEPTLSLTNNSLYVHVQLKCIPLVLNLIILICTLLNQNIVSGIHMINVFKNYNFVLAKGTNSVSIFIGQNG